MKDRLLLLHRRILLIAAFFAVMAFSGGVGFESPYFYVPTFFLAIAWFLRIPERYESVYSVASTILGFGFFLYSGITILDADGFIYSLVRIVYVILILDIFLPLHSRNIFRIYALSVVIAIAGVLHHPTTIFLAGVVLFGFSIVGALMIGNLLKLDSHRIDFDGIGFSLKAYFTVVLFVGLIAPIAFVVAPRPAAAWGLAAEGQSETAVGFGDEVDLGHFGGRIRSGNRIAFRVQFEDTVPRNVERLYWKGRSFEFFDGQKWIADPQVISAIPPGEYRQRWGGDVLRYEVRGGPRGAQVLFGVHPILSVELLPEMGPRAMAFGGVSGDYMYYSSREPAYRMWSGPQRPPEEMLRSAPLRGAVPGNGAFLQIPRNRLSDRFFALADSLTSGYETRYEKVLAVERYLSREFGYTTQLPSTLEETSIDYFLFNRREGHCEYFSTAMVLLLRAVGIESRNVTGFSGGRWHESTETLVVFQRAAHSWVEVFFPTVGWVPFEPTPASVEESGVGGGMFAMLSRFEIPYTWTLWLRGYTKERQIEIVRGFFGTIRDVVVSPIAFLVAGMAVLLVAIGVVVRRRFFWTVDRYYIDLRRRYEKARGVPSSANSSEFVSLLNVEARSGLRFVEVYRRVRFGGVIVPRSMMYRVYRDAVKELRAAR
jgi:protein-glutamine gamma-glutamyltransferase